MCIVFKKCALARAHLVSLAAVFSLFTLQVVELVIVSRCQCGKKTTNEYFIWLLFLTSISLQGKCIYLNRVVRIKPLLSPMQVQVRVTVLQGRAVGLVWGRGPCELSLTLRSSGGGAAFKRLLEGGASQGRAAGSSRPRRMGPRALCHSWMCRELCGLEAVCEPGQKHFPFCKLEENVNVQLRHNCVSPACSLTGLARVLCFGCVVLGSKRVLLRSFFF